MKPLGVQQLFRLLVVVVERRQSSESQCGREGGEDREGPSQVAPDRLQESGKHLRGEQEGAEELNEAQQHRKTAGRRGRQQRDMGRDASHLSDRLL